MTNKHFLFCVIILFYFFNCQTTNTTHKNELTVEKLSKEEQLQKLYSIVVKPMFTVYKNINIPSSFIIDTNNNSINAGAANNYLEVSQGLVNYDKKHIQIYVLAHEIAHIVTLNQASKFNLGNSIPPGKTMNEYKKSEYLADLIAIHLINLNEPKQIKLLNTDFDTIKQILGSSDYMHPSGAERVELMKKYINESEKELPSNTFKKMFIEIWNLS